MATIFHSLAPNTILSPFPDRNRPINRILNRTHLSNFHNQTPLLRGSTLVTRAGLGQIPGPVPDGLFARVEGLLYTIADAAVNGSAVDKVTEAAANDVATKQNGDWLSGITNAMEAVLKVLKDGLSSLHVPYAYGFAIILLTVVVKAATFPLTKKQVESAMAMRSLAPQIKAIQERYAGDQERIQLETARLYKLAGINPLAGCLPTLATIPIWIGLYRALSNVANEGLLTEGFFWIPSLAGPTTIAARQTGGGTSWLFPFIDGHPPLGWSDTLAYLVLPVLLVISQYISIQIMQPSQSSDPNQKTNQVLTRFLPLMIGYFSLSVPSGLSLYWFTNNILSTAQQVWLQKLGGAKNLVSQLSEDLKKKDPSIIEKSISEPTTVKKVIKENKTPTAEGPRPGERFKQLKEQEARRRRQREEEKRKAVEAATKGIQIANEEPKKEVNLVETEDKSRTELHDASSLTNISNSSIAENRVLNGDSTSQRLEEDQETTVNIVSNGQTTNDSENGKGDWHLDENSEKEEVVSAVKLTEKLSGESAGEDRSD